MVAVGGDEDLCLVTETAEGDRMNDPVAVALEDVAWTAGRAIGFRKSPAAGSVRVRGKW
jgi:hypothetical protein